MTMTWKNAGLALGVAALLTPAALDGARAETTLRLVPQADLQVLDSVWTTAAITVNHGNMIYDQLFALDDDMQPQPQMVDTWEVSEDGLVWTFTLREGLQFHDGSPVTAEDVVATVARWAERDTNGRAILQRGGSFEAIDDNTFQITTTEPFGPMIESLGKPSGNILHIMRAEDAATPADQQVTETVGSGPFTFVRDEWTPGDRVVYARNPDYVPRDEEASGQAGGKVAKVDRVEWIYIPDPNTATQALVAGEVDIYEIPPTDLLGLMEATGEIEIRVLDRLGKQGYARFNHLHHPFDNVLARRAVLMARDQAAYMSAMIGDPRFWEECYSFFVCGSPHETLVGAEPYMQQDLERARELVEESGYDGRPIVLMDPTDQLIIHNNTLVTAQLMREIGFNVDLQAMDWSSLTSRRPVKDDPATSAAGWHIFHTWSLGLELTSPLANFGISSACDESGWFGWSCNERIEELRTAWVSETDAARRLEIVEELHAEVYDHVPYVPAGQFFAPIAYRTNVTGILDTPLLVLWNIEKD